MLEGPDGTCGLFSGSRAPAATADPGAAGEGLDAEALDDSGGNGAAGAAAGAAEPKTLALQPRQLAEGHTGAVRCLVALLPVPAGLEEGGIRGWCCPPNTAAAAAAAGVGVQPRAER